MELQETPENPNSPSATSGEHPNSSNPSSSLLPVICVASNDEVWANLLVQNLSARGAFTVQCDLRSLSHRLASIAAGSWVVVDGGWPMFELQSAVEELNSALKRAKVTTVMIVDELVGQHPLAAFEPDRIINRTADMPALVRQLLAIIGFSSSDQPEPAL